MTAELVIRWSGGELDLMGWNSGPYGDFLIETLAEGTEWGNPEPVRRKLRRFLLDGSTSVKEYDDNRTVPLSLRVKAADGVALAGGEKALDLLDGQRCELAWTPPDGFSAAAVFVVDSADLRHKFDDFAEATRLERFYSLTLDCLPHVRSVDRIALQALPAEATVLDVEVSGDQLAWVGEDVTFSYLAGRVTVDSNFPPFPGAAEPNEYIVHAPFAGYDFVMTRPYFYAIGKEVPTVLSNLGVPLPYLGSEPVDGGDDWIYFFQGAIGMDIRDLRWTVGGSTDPGFLFSVWEMGQASAPTISAGRQSLRLFDVPGSRRAAADIVVSARDIGTSDTGGTSLGDVIVYTGPQYDPRVTLNGGTGRNGTPAETETLSGAYDLITASSGGSYLRLASGFPTGSYALWARTRLVSGGPSNVTIGVDIDLTHVSAVNVKVADVDTLSVPVALSTSYALRPLGRVELPGMALAKSAGYLLRFGLSPSSDIRVDELLAFNLTSGQLTIVETSALTFRTLHSGVWTTRTGASQVRVEAATLDHDIRVRASRGSTPDAQAASLTSAIKAWPGAHFLEPGADHLYVGTTEYAGAATTAEFAPTWHTHPAL